MRKSRRILISTTVFVTITGIIFLSGKPQTSFAQGDGFKLYQLNVFCGDTSLVTKIFTQEATEGGTVGRPLMGTKVICVGNCGGNTGPVTLDAALAGLPGKVSTALRAQVDNYQENAAAVKSLTCLGDDKKPEKRCEQSTPWLDGSSDDRTSKCKDRQPWKIEFDSKGFAFLTMCGSSVFVHNLKYRDGPSQRTYRFDLGYYVSKRIGNTVCCDSFKESAHKGSSCDPRSDLDCDGISNGTDVTEGGRFPDITTFGVGPGIPINDTDPPPSCFEPPDPNGCDCKWELMQGKRTRGSLSYASQYFYEGTWRCPSTGEKARTQRSVDAAGRCLTETKKSFFLVPDRKYTNGFRYSF